MTEEERFVELGEHIWQRNQRIQACEARHRKFTMMLFGAFDELVHSVETARHVEIGGNVRVDELGPGRRALTFDWAGATSSATHTGGYIDAANGHEAETQTCC